MASFSGLVPKQAHQVEETVNRNKSEEAIKTFAISVNRRIKHRGDVQRWKHWRTMLALNRLQSASAAAPSKTTTTAAVTALAEKACHRFRLLPAASTTMTVFRPSPMECCNQLNRAHLRIIWFLPNRDCPFHLVPPRSRCSRHPCFELFPHNLTCSACKWNICNSSKADIQQPHRRDRNSDWCDDATFFVNGTHRYMNPEIIMFPQRVIRRHLQNFHLITRKLFHFMRKCPKSPHFPAPHNFFSNIQKKHSLSKIQKCPLLASNFSLNVGKYKKQIFLRIFLLFNKNNLQYNNELRATFMNSSWKCIMIIDFPSSRFIHHSHGISWCSHDLRQKSCQPNWWCQRQRFSLASHRA